MALVTDSMGGGHPEFDRNHRIYAPRTLTADSPFFYMINAINMARTIPILSHIWIYLCLSIWFSSFFPTTPKKSKKHHPHRGFCLKIGYPQGGFSLHPCEWPVMVCLTLGHPPLIFTVYHASSSSSSLLAFFRKQNMFMVVIGPQI